MVSVRDQQSPSGGSIQSNLGENKNADGIIADGVAGENVKFGDLLYQSIDNGFWYKALATSELTMPVKAMAAWTQSSGRVLPILRQGYVRLDTWSFVNGMKVYVDTVTAGNVTMQAPNDYRQEVGAAESKNIIYFNPEHNVHYGYNDRIILKDLQADVDILFKRQSSVHKCNIWEYDTGNKPLITGKHGRLKIRDAMVYVSDNNYVEQYVEIIGITEPLNIASTYSSGVAIPLNVIRSFVGLNEQIDVYSTGGRRIAVELQCDNNEDD